MEDNKVIVVGISGYACNGKTSLCKALSVYLKTSMNINNFIMEEPVKKILDIFNDEYLSKNIDLRQKLLLATTNVTLNTIESIKYNVNDKLVIITDRTILDYIVFTDMFCSCLNPLTHSEIKYSTSLYDYMFLIKPPKYIHTIEHCFDSDIRKNTIDKDTFKESADKFTKLYEDTVYEYKLEDKFYKISSPSVNTYVLFEIIDKISKSL